MWSSFLFSGWLAHSFNYPGERILYAPEGTPVQGDNKNATATRNDPGQTESGRNRTENQRRQPGYKVPPRAPPGRHWYICPGRDKRLVGPALPRPAGGGGRYPAPRESRPRDHRPPDPEPPVFDKCRAGATMTAESKPSASPARTWRRSRSCLET